MHDEVSKHHYVFHTASGQIIMELDTGLTPPGIGTVMHLPSLSNEEMFLPYRITEVEFAPQSQEKITIYIEVELV